MNSFPTSLSFEEALAAVRDVAGRHVLDVERVPLSRCHGRFLAHDLVASMPLPSFDNSAMDGFACRSADLAPEGTELRLAGEQFAGPATVARVGQGDCVRITTGAPMPPGADTVAIKERVRLDGQTVILEPGTVAGANVRHAGEDVRPGDCVIRAGHRLTPARVSLAAAQGQAELEVRRRPTVAVFTSGDELVEPGLPLAPGQIHDSNRHLLMGLLRADGLEPTAWPRLPDDARSVEIALRDAACAFDLVITCGAVSAGEKDHIPAVVMQEARAGRGEVHFWKVRMKPGMPLLFATLDQARLIGLPGNPVSVLATYLTLGRALIDGLQGRSEPRLVLRAVLESGVDKAHPRREFMRGRMFSDEGGVLRVEPHPASGSHRLRAAADSNALLVIPETANSLLKGAVVEVIPLG
ncbi:MAG: molybdopterin molybdotransferase MoeA [Pseudomonadota bacterium]|nr:molybdopterin molybdotransferase MoeA [Pseudomonadota bacterium]